MRNSTLIFITAVMVLYLWVDVSGVVRCKGKPGAPKCNGTFDSGNNRRRKCKDSANKNMWHYNTMTRNCTKINYLGCGGNDNRWCTKVLCEGCRPRV
ncbi:tissue factor pathway inhibitor [Drosophila takahashii]|uniref:tissue factor pathway inhibitor n=1 Tax=Drosophila takahashii TaxID=29030 RepID=UPI0007E85B73|nr:tissue factor pathway inhibitor [Drosophila takahashii]